MPIPGVRTPWDTITAIDKAEKACIEERGRSTAGSCVFLHSVHVHATTPGARHIVSVSPRPSVSHLDFPRKRCQTSGSSVCLNNSPPHACVVRIPNADMYWNVLHHYIHIHISVHLCCPIPAEALVNFGRHLAVLSAIPRKRCMIFADPMFNSVNYLVNTTFMESTPSTTATGGFVLPGSALA